MRTTIIAWVIAALVAACGLYVLQRSTEHLAYNTPAQAHIVVQGLDSSGIETAHAGQQ